MKKFIFIFSVLLAASCTDDTLIEETKVAEASAIKDSLNLSTQRAGDGAFDLLGYGFNATGDYANANSAGGQVINISLLNSQQPDRVVIEFPYSQVYTEIYGEDAKKYSQIVTGKVFSDPTIGLFTGTLDFSNTTTSTYDSKYIFGSYNKTIYQKRLRLNRTPLQLQQFLTPTFLNDLTTQTPAQLVANYGTHVTTDIYTGAKLEVLFRSQTFNFNRDIAAKAMVKSGFNSLFDATVNNDAAIKENDRNFDRQVWYKTRGGNPNIGLSGTTNLNQAPQKLNFSNWQSSSTAANSVLVDFAPNGIKLIYEFIANPPKKAEVKAYVDQYLINKKVSLTPSPPPVAATFYKNANFNTTNGYAIGLPIGDYTLSQLQAKGILNDDISSILVASSSIEVIVYYHDFFQAGVGIPTVVPDLGSWDNKISSVIIRNRAF